MYNENVGEEVAPHEQLKMGTDCLESGWNLQPWRQSLTGQSFEQPDTDNCHEEVFVQDDFQMSLLP